MVNNKKSRPVALITGATGGLGRALALRFAQEGHDVVLHYHSRAKQAVSLAQACKRRSVQAMALQADIGDARQVRAMFEQIHTQCKRMDVLVHAAGHTDPCVLPRLSAEQFDAMLRTHVKGAFLCTQAAAALMKKQKSGSIIYIGSLLGLKGVHGECHYAAAKAALCGLAKSAAYELGPFGICVNVVLPGFMLTPMGYAMPVAVRNKAKQENVLKRWTDPGDAARMIVELSRARWISGQVLNFDARIP